MDTLPRVWIDLDNSPHVPFFKPIIAELEKSGYAVVVTARDCFQVCGLTELLNLPCKRIGRHYGKNKIAKACGLLYRALQLAPTIVSERPVLALSHGSRSQSILATLLRIPRMTIFDYEHARGIPLIRSDSIIVPEVIQDSMIRRKFSHIGRYPGIKEDVYVPNFSPQPGLLQKLGIDTAEVVVTVRPPATEAHYHSCRSDELFEATIAHVSAHPRTRMVLLPRNERQEHAVRDRWPELFEAGKIVIPDHVIDGLNLIWHSDLVISGGGTMNREAASLGAPVYSIFRGEIGVVDRYLANRGRLILIESAEDVRTKIELKKWNRPNTPDTTDRPALRCIVKEVLAFLEAQGHKTLKKNEA